MKRIITIILAAVLLSGCQKHNEPVGIGEVDGALLSSGGDGEDWLAIGYSYDEQRFSPLDQINESNVAQLGLAWSADLPDIRGQEATPIAIDGKIYIGAPWSKVFAYDGASGKLLWSFDPGVDKAKVAEACCDAVNRGVAAWKGMIYVGALDGRLIALDAETGKQVWSVQTTDPAKPQTITGAPRVVKGLVIIGNGGAEYGVRGYVTAYDAKTGKKRWRFYTVPNPDGVPDGEVSDAVLKSKAQGTWSAGGQWKQSGGGGTVWDAIVYDAELDQLYLGVGNGNPWNHTLRSEGKGDNLFLSSIVALKPETGEYVWHYQETPGESWDYTATQPIILSTLNIAGKSRKVLMHAPKNGFFFVIDRTDGKLISANPYVDGVNWASGYDLKTGRPIENPAARYDKTGKTFLVTPSGIGAHNWHPMSFNPKVGLVYIPAQNISTPYNPPVASEDKERQPLGFNLGIAITSSGFPHDTAVIKAATEQMKGALVAWDPVAGKARWQVEYPVPWNGGTMTTAGNLVFQGTALGEFHAYAADSGKPLFTYQAGSGIVGAASTFMIDGVQYVAVLSGRGGAFPLVMGYGLGKVRQVPNIPRLLVFKLGGTKQLKQVAPTAPGNVKLPSNTGTPQQIAQGNVLFGRYCRACHGANAAGGSGITPDLQSSATLSSADAWRSILIDGALASNGMVSFAKVISPQQAESIRLYVIDEAHWASKNLKP